MDPFHERLARVALRVAASYGFALAGGYAVQAHGFLDRPSADVDLFAAASAQFDFPEAVDAVIFGRAEIRDYVDVAAILSSGRYSDDDLVRLAAEHDPGFDLAWFTEALEAVDRIPDTGFAEYGLDPSAASALRARMHAWAKKISGS
jgi:hypothetical protein